MNPFNKRKAKKVIIDPSPDEKICYNKLCRKLLGSHFKVLTIRDMRAPICLRCNLLIWKQGSFKYNGHDILIDRIQKR